MKLFVYGTLRDNQEATHYVEGFVLFPYEGREFSFPYIVPVETDSVQVFGNILDIPEEDLPDYDRYENVQSGLYVRQKVSVIPVLGGEAVEAQAYVAGPSLCEYPIPSGDWYKR